MNNENTLAPYFQLKEDGLVFASSLEDFPVIGDGTIRLLDNHTYFIAKSIDFRGNRLIAGRNTTIIGGSSENCILSSTGLDANVPLVSSRWSLPMRSLAISHGTALDLDANGNANQALDWFGVNFLNCATVGRIANYNNFIMTDSSLLNSSGLSFDGTIGTVGFNQCLFDNQGGTALTIEATAVISRRVRVIYSAFVALAGEIAIHVAPAASVPIESYILDTVNFSGGGTYIDGVQYNDNKALFSNCRGINNTKSSANYFMRNNATATTVALVDTAYKAAGTTTAGEIEKFSHSNNRATYLGALSKKFTVTATVTCTSGNNHQIGVYIAKNGILDNPSEIYGTTSGTGRAENITVQTLIELVQNDYIEVWVENATSATNIVVAFLNVIIRE